MSSPSFESIFNSLNDRIKNPALFSILCVILFRNWKLFLIVFNLNEFKNIDSKILEIQKYLDEKYFLQELFFNIFFSILLIIISLVVIFLSEMVLDFYYKYILKIWKKFVDKKQIVIQDDIDLFKNEKNTFLSKIESLEKENISLRRANVELESNVKLKKDTLENVEYKLSNVQNELLEFERKYNVYKSLFETVENTITDLYDNILNIKNYVENNSNDYEGIRSLLVTKMIDVDYVFLNSIVDKYYILLNDEEYSNLFDKKFYLLSNELLTSLIKDKVIKNDSNSYQPDYLYESFINMTLTHDSERFNDIFTELPF